MAFTSAERHQLLRMTEKIVAPDCRAAFNHLFAWACIESGLHVRAKNRTAFAAIHLAVDPDGPEEFGFISAGSHLKWYFRKPGLTSRLWTWETIQHAYPEADMRRRYDEITLDLKSFSEARALTNFVDRLLQ